MEDDKPGTRGIFTLPNEVCFTQSTTLVPHCPHNAHVDSLGHLNPLTYKVTPAADSDMPPISHADSSVGPQPPSNSGRIGWTDIVLRMSPPIGPIDSIQDVLQFRWNRRAAGLTVRHLR